MSTLLGGNGRSVINRNRRRRAAKLLLVVVVFAALAMGWVLQLVEHVPALRRAAADVHTEVARFLFKKLMDPSCVAPGFELGENEDLIPAENVRFQECNKVVPTARDATVGGSRPGSPKVYILEHMAALITPKDPALPQLCSDQDFHRNLAANRTGMIVSNPSDATLFYVPYYAGCLSREVLRKEAKSGRLFREYVAALRATPQWWGCTSSRIQLTHSFDSAKFHNP
jgi:hypothetical protein